MNKLVALVFGPDDQVKEDVAAQIIAGLSRSELKRFLAAFRLEMRRRIVQVALAGEGGRGLVPRSPGPTPAGGWTWRRTRRWARA